MADVEMRTHIPTPMPTALVGLAVAAMVLVFAALLFVLAGRLDWAFGWIYVSIIVTYVVSERKPNFIFTFKELSAINKMKFFS